MQVVTKETLPGVLAGLETHDVLAFDTETTGLSSFHGSRMFSLAVSTLECESYYFDFSKEFEFKELKPLMDQPRLWVGHNAKFDLHFCAKSGVMPRGKVCDTKSLARLFENNHKYYSLDACAERYLDVRKDDRVMAWMQEHHGYTTEPGRKRNYQFDLVPFEIISEYAMKDAEVTASLFKFLRDNMYENQLQMQEIDLTTVLFHMERLGVQIDQGFVFQAQSYEQTQINNALTLLPKGFIDSAKFLKPHFEAIGVSLPLTDKGNDKIDDDFLRSVDHPFAESVRSYREADKRLNTYWKAYAELTDHQGVLHTSFDPAGTVTGRFSCRDPNLQNIPKDDKSEYPVRRAFVARPGRILVSIDYRAVELRIALEYAGETELIEMIKQGLDPHQKTANQTGLSRDKAKTLNFQILYGAGANALSKFLDCTKAEAARFKTEALSVMPKVRGLIADCERTLKSRKYISNIFGRRSRFETFQRYGRMSDNSYKACNLLIQGSAADIMKKAMVSVHEFLKDKPAKMILTIHDELIIEMDQNRLDLIHQIQGLMTSAYAHKSLPLETSVKIGPNLFEMTKYAGPA